MSDSFKGPAFPVGVQMTRYDPSEGRAGAVVPRIYLSDGKGGYHYQYSKQGRAILDRLREEPKNDRKSA